MPPPWSPSETSGAARAHADDRNRGGSDHPWAGRLPGSGLFRPKGAGSKNAEEVPTNLGRSRPKLGRPTCAGFGRTCGDFSQGDDGSTQARRRLDKRAAGSAIAGGCQMSAGTSESLACGGVVQPLLNKRQHQVDMRQRNNDEDFAGRGLCRALPGDDPPSASAHPSQPRKAQPGVPPTGPRARREDAPATPDLGNGPWYETCHYDARFCLLAHATLRPQARLSNRSGAIEAHAFLNDCRHTHCLDDTGHRVPSIMG